jgi:hypothetical protein
LSPVIHPRAELADFTPENGPLSAISGRFSGFFLYESEILRGPTPIRSAIPEPETYAMILAGLGVLGLSRARRPKVCTA